MRSKQDQKVWDAAATAVLSALAPLGATGDVDDYGPREVANDATNFADAFMKQREERARKRADEIEGANAALLGKVVR